jgi:hypothetical protein
MTSPLRTKNPFATGTYTNPCKIRAPDFEVQETPAAQALLTLVLTLGNGEVESSILSGSTSSTNRSITYVQR